MDDEKKNGQKPENAASDLRITNVSSRDDRKKEPGRVSRKEREEAEARSFFASLRSNIRLPQDAVSRWLFALVMLMIAAALIGFWVFNRVHLFDSCRVLSSAEKLDVEGTQYARLGSHLIKYSHDGVFCVNMENENVWSVAYSMQTPVCDICGDVMAIAEQQGRQVYVINEEGLVGSYETNLNIRKVRVAANGVTALVQDDDDVTWINLYGTDGSQIAAVRTSIEESGYPLDLALTTNARRMMVSCAAPENGALTGKLFFYDFSSASDDRHLMQTLSYADTVFPEIFYGDDSVPVAVGDNCFLVFDSGKRPSLREEIPFGKEIVSCFHDGANVGFVFPAEETDVKYEIEVYNLSGKRTMEKDCSVDYSGIDMLDGEILLYDTRNLNAYRPGGRQKLSLSYPQAVRYFAPLPGQRNYLVVTENSIDRIRAE